MGNKAKKVQTKLARRRAAYELIVKLPGHVYHKPGSQNLRKN